MTSMRTRLIAVLTAAGTLTGAGLVASTSAQAQPRAAHHRRTVTLAKSGDRISVHKGNRLRLDLKTAYDGGYSWSFTQRPQKSVLRVVKKTLKPYPHPKGVVGYPYHTYYLLKPVGAGTTTVKLIERQPFDHKNVARHFTLTIHVPHRPAR